MTPHMAQPAWHNMISKRKSDRELTLKPPLVSNLHLADVQVTVAYSSSQELVAAALIAISCAREQLIPADTVAANEQSNLLG